jgi:hypothetical protein
MLGLCRCLLLACLLLVPAPLLAERVDVGSAEHLALIEGLPEARAAVQAEQAHDLEHGLVAEVHEANAAIVQFLADSWLALAAVWPEDHFGTPTHADYLDTFTLARISFFRAINTFPAEAMEGPVLSVLIGNRLVKDLDQFVADTATAQLAQHDPVLSLEWLSRWQAAAR